MISVRFEVSCFTPGWLTVSAAFVADDSKNHVVQQTDGEVQASYRTRNGPHPVREYPLDISPVLPCCRAIIGNEARHLQIVLTSQQGILVRLRGVGRGNRIET